HGSDGQHLLTRSVSKVQRGHPTCGSTRDGHPIRIHTVLLSMASYPSQHLGDILRSGHHCFLEFGMKQAIFAQSFGHIGGCTSTPPFCDVLGTVCSSPTARQSPVWQYFSRNNPMRTYLPRQIHHRV